MAKGAKTSSNDGPTEERQRERRYRPRETTCQDHVRDLRRRHQHETQQGDYSRQAGVARKARSLRLGTQSWSVSVAEPCCQGQSRSAGRRCSSCSSDPSIFAARLPRNECAIFIRTLSKGATNLPCGQLGLPRISNQVRQRKVLDQVHPKPDVERTACKMLLQNPATLHRPDIR